MNEPPNGVDIAQLLEIVRASWDASVDDLQLLPVGFGAHHWRASVGGDPRYFVTLDVLGELRTREILLGAYGGASALARQGLTFVVAPLEPYAVPYGAWAVTLTPWLEGAPVDAIDEDATAEMLRRLHAVDENTLGLAIPQWRPVVGPDFADRIREMVQQPWTGGPYGSRSRDAVAGSLSNIDRWTARYQELNRLARTRRWVPTHGEPGGHNQLVVAAGTVIVDWETLKLAPPERDLRTLDRGDPLMLEMFDLEWRLDEIGQYSAWVAGKHGDTADDRIAFEGFMHELDR